MVSGKKFPGEKGNVVPCTATLVPIGPLLGERVRVGGTIIRDILAEWDMTPVAVIVTV